jgi:hypothetical protein
VKGYEISRACSTNGEKRHAYRLLAGTAEGKRLLLRPRCRWTDNIKMDVGEMGWDDVDWIGLAEDRDKWRRAHMNTVMNLRMHKVLRRMAA